MARKSSNPANTSELPQRTPGVFMIARRCSRGKSLYLRSFILQDNSAQVPIVIADQSGETVDKFLREIKK